MSGAADRSSGGDTLRDNLHDLRNLLAAIVSGAHLLADPLQAKRRQTVLEAIDAAGRRSSSILSALLSGAAKMASDMCDPAAQVSGLAPILTALAGGSVEVTLKLQAGGSTIACAGDRFDRIVVELVTNARRATGECGRIELRVRHGRGHAWIIVADNGTGMGSRRLARLWQGASADYPVGHGNGLGQVRTFVSQAGGVLRVRSRLGQGTVVAMILPHRAATTGTRDIADTAQGAGDLESMAAIRFGGGNEECSGADA